VIHFTNGDSVRNTLLEAGVEGEIVIAADVLHEGPCPSNLSPQTFDDVRAQYLAGRGYAPLDAIRLDFAARAEAIKRAAREDEVVLWFEHDLFDQLNLIWLLDRFRTAGVPSANVRLIVVGDFPGVVPFHGLGQLTAEQLKGLYLSRTTLRPDQVEYACAAWNAVCQPTPEAVLLLSLKRQLGRMLMPFVPSALVRLLEELPGHLDGLSRTERQGLAAIAGGAKTLDEAFWVQGRQESAS
jgi:hypothetical protein